jgi:DNA-binding MarR family transcriptional regulator
MKQEVKIDYILQHFTSLFTRDSDQILLEQLGIGYSQYKILRILKSGKPVKQKFIANTLGQTEASISRQIDILINKQLIDKYKDPRNLRVRLITITVKGRKIADATNKVLGNYLQIKFTGFSEKKQVELFNLLIDLHSSVCESNHSLEIDYISYLVDN